MTCKKVVALGGHIAKPNTSVYVHSQYMIETDQKAHDEIGQKTSRSETPRISRPPRFAAGIASAGLLVSIPGKHLYAGSDAEHSEQNDHIICS